MIDFPREVREGDKISATEYNRVVRVLRRLYPIQGPGIRLSASPNGTVFTADVPAAQAAGPISVCVVTGAGCYELVDAEETEGGQTVTRKYLSNQYYVDGGVIKSTNFSNPLDPSTHYGKFLALRAPMTSNGTAALAAYDTFALMHTASLDLNFVTIALYQLDANGDIVCDFRNIPHAQAVENLS